MAAALPALEIRDYDDLPKAALAQGGDLVAFQAPGAPLQTIELNRLIGKLGPVDLVVESAAELTLAHAAGKLAIVWGDEAPARLGYYVKEGAAGAGAWRQSQVFQSSTFIDLPEDSEVGIGSDLHFHQAKGDGVSDDRPAFVAAASELGGGTEVTVARGRFRLNSNLVIDNPLRFEGGARLVVPDGVVVTLRGPLTAPPLRIFECLGSGRVELEGAQPPALTEWWGAKGDGMSDDAPAFNAAARASRKVQLLARSYALASEVVIVRTGAVWSGEGSDLTRVVATSAADPVFRFADGLNGVTIEEMKLTRTASASAGGNGIDCSAVPTGQALLRSLIVEKQHIGLALGVTDYSEVEDVIVQGCLGPGIKVSNTAAFGFCQWSFDNVLAQVNGAQGWLFQSVAGPGQMTIGTMRGCAGYANNSSSVAFVGRADCPIPGVRMIGGFFGEDGNNIVYLDTYGDQHILDGVFAELAGRIKTGPGKMADPNGGVAPSGTGSGFAITANNGTVQLTGCHATANSLDGFDLNGTSHSLGNCRAMNNGQAATAGRRNGIRSTSGRVVVNGGIYGNTAGVSQQHAADVSDGNNLSIGFADLTGNSAAAWRAVANPTFVTSVGNLPNNLPVGLAPQGPVLIGGSATGDFNAPGTINVSGGVLKNDVPYAT